MKKYLNKKNQELLDKFKVDGKFSPDYVKYDERGVKHTGCMMCGTAVIVRAKEIIKCPHCEKEIIIQQNNLKELPNHIKVKKNLADGSYLELISCINCASKFEDLTEEEEKRVIAQLCYGWAKDMTFGKRPEKQIKKYIERMEKIRFVKDDPKEEQKVKEPKQ